MQLFLHMQRISLCVVIFFIGCMPVHVRDQLLISCCTMFLAWWVKRANIAFCRMRCWSMPPYCHMRYHLFTMCTSYVCGIKYDPCERILWFHPLISVHFVKLLDASVKYKNINWWKISSNELHAEGQLGYTSVDSQATPRRVSSLRAKIVAVAAANKHSAAVSESGEVFTWGCNKEGQLGYGTSNSASNYTPRVVEYLKGKILVGISAAKYHTIVLGADGEVNLSIFCGLIWLILNFNAMVLINFNCILDGILFLCDIN